MLKKCFCCILVLFLFLAGCKSSIVTPICENLRFNANITYYNEQYLCPTEIAADGTITVKVSQPEILGGLTLKYLPDGSVSATLGDIVYTPNPQNSYYVSITDCMAAAFRDTKGQNIENKGDAFIYEGVFNSKPYRICFTDKGIPLNMETGDIKIEFCDISVF